MLEGRSDLDGRRSGFWPLAGAARGGLDEFRSTEGVAAWPLVFREGGRLVEGEAVAVWLAW